MPPTLVATVGSSLANSYVTLAEFETYLDERLVTSTAAAAADADQNRALIEATRRVDQETFIGSPVNPLNGTSTGTTQALKWPRYSATNDDGWTYESTVIPQPVKDAVMELAIALLNSGTADAMADSGLEAFESVKVGPLEVVPRHARKAAALPSMVRRLLRTVLDGESAGGVTFVKG